MLCAGFILSACSDDALYGDLSTSGSDAGITYAVCTNRSAFDVDHELVSSDLTGNYIKTRELECSVAGCEEVPISNVIYPGAGPTFVLKEDGTLENPTGPLSGFDSWTYIPTESADVNNQIEFKSITAQDSSLKLSIYEAGPCLLRIENDQGWIEYARLTAI